MKTKNEKEMRNCELIRNNMEFVKNKAYFMVREKYDINRIDNLCKAFESGKINSFSDLMDETLRLVKRITSDHAMHRWEYISEFFEELIKGDSRYSAELEKLSKKNEEEDEEGCEITQEVFDILEDKYGFATNGIQNVDNGYFMEFGQYTPLGEDWWECIYFDGTNEDFAREIRDLYENFSVDDEVEIWIPYRGQNGVPESISDLLDDARWKDETLRDLALDLEELIIKQRRVA